jgi:hypothetical protein
MKYGKAKSRMWLVLVAAVPAAAASAQMPGAPVLQNAWAAPGSVVAADFSGGGGASVYAGALGWTPASGRYQLSAGAGWQSVKAGSSRGVYGVRLAMPLMQAMAGRLGVAGFVGVGGGASKAATRGDSLQAKLVVPAGGAISYRQAVGTAGRGFSVYLTPHYQYMSRDAGNMSGFNFGYGLDLGVTPRFGLTVGGESGASGGTSSLWGAAISMKLGR